MRVAFLGNDPWSVPPLEALAGSTHRPALVVTRVPRPAGRGGRPRPTPVAEAARSLELPLAEVETVKRPPGLDELREAAPEALVVVAYGEILPQEVLDVPTRAPVNLHFSLLPKLRGADPVRRALLEGHEETGVTTIRMDAGMDTGPVLLAAREPIGDGDDAGSLGARLAEVGGRLLVETLDALERGTLTERVQQHEEATLAPKLSAEDEWIDWSEPADAVLRRVRALAPDPGARTRFAGRILKVMAASPREAVGEPGTLVEVGKDGVTVAAGRGGVSLDAVLPEGRRRITGAEFARGYRPRAGDRLG